MLSLIGNERLPKTDVLAGNKFNWMDGHVKSFAFLHSCRWRQSKIRVVVTYATALKDTKSLPACHCHQPIMLRKIAHGWN